MPRNSFGIYTAPSSSWNPATSDTTISSGDWNPLLADLSQGLTESIATDGSTVVTTPIPFLGGIIGNATTSSSTAKWTTGRTIGITGDLTYTSPSFDGSVNVTAAATLATVNSNVGTFGSINQVVSFTVDAKGRITAASNAGTLGTAAQVNTGTSGATVPLLSAANTWGSVQTFTGAVTTPQATPAVNEVGYLGAPQNSQSGSYTLVMSDCGKHIYHPSGAGAGTWTIPANASVAAPIGTVIVLANETGASNLTIAINSDTLRWSNSTGSRTLSAGGTASLLKVAATTWRLTGDLIS